MFTGDNIISLISIVMTAITSIGVAWLGMIHNRKEKKDSEYRELQATNEQLKQEKNEIEKKQHAERLEKIESSLESLSKDVSSITEALDLNTVEKQLSNLHILTQTNFKYIQSLSNVVITIGEVVDDLESVDDSNRNKLRIQIEDHRKTEDEVNNQLYSIII